MALVELSGIQDILKKNTEDGFLSDMKYLTANFDNQMQLSLPPFSNVSTFHCLFLLPFSLYFGLSILGQFVPLSEELLFIIFWVYFTFTKF